MSTRSRSTFCHESKSFIAEAGPASAPDNLQANSRRQFIGAMGAIGASTLLGLGNASRAHAATQEQPKGNDGVRAIFYNVLACTGWPRNRSRAKLAVAKNQMAQRMAMELALYDPDIVALAESPRENLTQEIARLLGMHHVRFAGGFPGTLMTRFKVLDSQTAPMISERPKDLFTRHWGRATLELPGGDPLIVHSIHLHPSANSPVRMREIEAMLASTKADFEAGRSMLMLGDLNHRPDGPEYPMWIDAGWIDTFARVGEGTGNTFLADAPSRRIDYIMGHGPIVERLTQSRPLFEGAFRTNPDDPDSFALSDHLPQLAVFAPSDA